MNKKLVVGIDDSASSMAALDWTVRRAAAVNAPVMLVHAVPENWTSDTTSYGRDIDSARAMLETAAMRAVGIAPSVEVRTRTHVGEPARALSDLSEDASLVIVGTDKSGTTEGRLTGAVSLQVATMSVSPVAVIPVAPRDPGTGIVVGVDGSAGSLFAADFAAAEAQRTGEELYAVHACEVPGLWPLTEVPGKYSTKRLEEEGRLLLTQTIDALSGRYPDLRIHQRFETGKTPAQVLLAAAHDAQLLVVGGRGRAALKRMSMGSIGHEMLLHIPCPTVITRIPAHDN